MEIEFNYNSLASLIAAAEKSGLPVSRLVLMQQAEQMEQSEDEIYRHMEETYRVMASCIEPGCAPDLRSTSGLTGGSAYKMSQVSKSGKSLTGSLLSGALYRALAVSELNASMGRIVAAPTAGSCGILPAALLTMQEEREIPERDCVMALFTASAVGIVIANNASLAGAQGGCQAECGSAAAMAAAAVTELAGGTPAMISHAVAIALKNILGLVCDPVGGLVEVPCQKRNATAASVAFVSAQIALSGVQNLISFDEAVAVMDEVGRGLPPELRETALGGIAKAPSACAFCAGC